MNSSSWNLDEVFEIYLELSASKENDPEFDNETLNQALMLNLSNTIDQMVSSMEELITKVDSVDRTLRTND